ncbi:unnamed protein product, partial [Adineta steineri]
MHQPPPTATHTMTGNITKPCQPQPVLIYQIPHHAPVMMNHGINMNPTMTPHIMAIPDYNHGQFSIFYVVVSYL